MQFRSLVFFILSSLTFILFQIQLNFESSDVFFLETKFSYLFSFV